MQCLLGVLQFHHEPQGDFLRSCGHDTWVKRYERLWKHVHLTHTDQHTTHPYYVKHYENMSTWHTQINTQNTHVMSNTMKTCPPNTHTHTDQHTKHPCHVKHAHVKHKRVSGFTTIALCHGFGKVAKQKAAQEETSFRGPRSCGSVQWAWRWSSKEPFVQASGGFQLVRSPSNPTLSNPWQMPFAPGPTTPCRRQLKSFRQKPKLSTHVTTLLWSLIFQIGCLKSRLWAFKLLERTALLFGKGFVVQKLRQLEAIIFFPGELYFLCLAQLFSCESRTQHVLVRNYQLAMLWLVWRSPLCPSWLGNDRSSCISSLGRWMQNHPHFHCYFAQIVCSIVRI